MTLPLIPEVRARSQGVPIDIPEMTKQIEMYGDAHAGMSGVHSREELVHSRMTHAHDGE